MHGKSDTFKKILAILSADWDERSFLEGLIFWKVLSVTLISETSSKCINKLWHWETISRLNEISDVIWSAFIRIWLTIWSCSLVFRWTRWYHYGLNDAFYLLPLIGFRYCDYFLNRQLYVSGSLLLIARHRLLF